MNQNLGEKRKTAGFYSGRIGLPILRVACSTNIKTKLEKENLIQSYASKRNVLDLGNSIGNHNLSALCGFLFYEVCENRMQLDRLAKLFNFPGVSS